VKPGEQNGGKQAGLHREQPANSISPTFSCSLLLELLKELIEGSFISAKAKIKLVWFSNQLKAKRFL